MDDEVTDVFVNRDDPIPVVRFDKILGTSTPSGTRPSAQDPDDSEIESPNPKRKGFRDRLSALKDRATLQDHLVEKLLAQVIPVDDGTGQPQGEASGKGGGSSSSGGGSALSSKPNFNLTTMSYNFRRFNSRIGVVFVFQARAIRLLSWRRPTHTLSFLAIYTFICLDPYLLSLLPLAVLLVGVMIPYFIARHPAAPPSLGSSSSSEHGEAIYYSARGPPLAPPVTVKPVKELSRDFFRNMRDLQNSMEDFSRLHDAVIATLVPSVNFSDEALSSAVFTFLFAAALFMSIAANVLPWRFTFLAVGWAAILAGHPSVQKQLESLHESHARSSEEKARGWMQSWVESDVILDSAPETREVEIFELQHLSSPEDGEWEAWMFSPSPYDPLSVARVAGDRPTGTRFFEDVMPPPGWEWSEKKWALDLWSREWVEERIITGVEVETEGERWVYDIFDEHAEIDRVGVAEEGSPRVSSSTASVAAKGKAQAPPARPTWEEGEDYEGRRGEWRRRRWVRMVKRRNFSEGKDST